MSVRYGLNVASLVAAGFLMVASRVFTGSSLS
jgi:hypothetical protein